MAAAIATEEAVREVALKIMQDPQLKLTNDTVIEMLGGGSKETVAPLLKKVREEFMKRGGTHEPVPSHLATEAEALVKRLHAAAKDEARREYEADTMRMSRIYVGMHADSEATTARAEAAEARIVQLQDELNAAELIIDELRTEVRALKGARSLLEANARTAQQDLDRANEVVASMKARAEESSRLEERLSRLEAAMPKVEAKRSPANT